MARKIMIIRHGEKPGGKDKIHGVDENGNHDDNEMTVQGWQRAGALVRLFAPIRGDFADRSLATPAWLYAPRATNHVGSVRSQHTLLPLARYLGKTVDTRFERDQLTDLVKAATAANGTVLIAWEHDRIPEIAAGITGKRETCPDHWPDDRFDLVWVFDQSRETEWSFSQVPQLVLAGDLKEIIVPKVQEQKSVKAKLQVGSAGA